MKIKKIFIGGWFQRTTLHLSEVWDFLRYERSFAGLDPTELKKLKANLNLESFSRENGPLEYIALKSKDDINYRFYEDGLMVFDIDPEEDIRATVKKMQVYFDEKFSAAIRYIFSKGAPVPKELANILSVYPYIFVVEGAKKAEIAELFKLFKEDIQSDLSFGKVSVLRSDQLIVINNIANEEAVREIVETQIFFREFKTQLHRYLSMHRLIWDKTQNIKERKNVKGKDLDSLINELWSYQKTINLIEARINQAGVYLKTRQKISALDKLDENIISLFQFRFETLADSYEYIKYLWAMTKNYLDSAINVFADLQGKATKEALSSLQLVTVVNVLGILANTYLIRQKFPLGITVGGFMYIFVFIILAFLINWLISFVSRRKEYSLEKLSDIYREIK